MMLYNIGHKHIGKSIALLSLGFATSCAQKRDLEDQWYVFKPNEDFSESVIDMGDWLDAPAGKHGYLKFEGEGLRFEDGTPIKFWGTNICSQLPYSEKGEVDRWIPFLAKYGINGVRFHKFSKFAIKGETSTEIDGDMFGKFDYFGAELKKKGIYYGWSHIYGHKIRPGDRDRLLAYDEVAALEYPWSHLNGSTASLVNFAPDLQDLSIELTVNMLNHVNVHTGLRYADDPALIFVELQNEDNIFWGAIGKALDQAPTYRALLCRQFSDWLAAKYKTDTALAKAWGIGQLPEGESMVNGTLCPQPDHAEFSSYYRDAHEKGMTMPQRVLDRMAFLHEAQNKFYDRYIRAIRDTGYKGLIVGSCWQAGMGPSHYYNLHADYRAGIIDRHNYYGGDGGHNLRPGPFTAVPMLAKPGSGLLSAGMQQVADRPFSFSEWIGRMPTEWITEATPLIGLYGMGLQGWDASFHFATNSPFYTDKLDSPNIYNVCAPNQLGFYPTIARSVYRGDIAEGDWVSQRNVHIPSLAEGKLGFFEKVEQGYDNKYITGDVPAELLALGKVGVTFTDEYRDTKVPEKLKNWNKEEKWIRSNTGELQWDYAKDGLVQINAAALQGLVGFPENRAYEFDDFEVKVSNPFATVLFSALEKDKTLESSEHVLLTTIARARNTGMTYNEQGDELLEEGTGPILLEAVTIDVRFKNGRVPKKIHVLDHVGRRTGTLLSSKGDKLVIDGDKTQTLYYEFEY